MNTRVLKANLLLLVAALVWGATFVAQKRGMDTIGPMAFTGLRFLLGAACLAPIAWKQIKSGQASFAGNTQKWLPLKGILAAGILMFLGINLQQTGLVHTTAGKAGFITGLYVIFVPILGLFWRQKVGVWGWMGISLALAGLYFLSMTSSFVLAYGDSLILACAFAWAGHVLVLGYFSPKMGSFVLAFGQAFVCAVLSLLMAFIVEDFTLGDIWLTRYPLFFGGVASVAIGFTLQVIGQKDSPPAHAAVILQLEAVFAAFFGWLLLAEVMSSRSILGAGLMLAGMLTAQLGMLRRSKSVQISEP
jgi:drug/metabolite transporter (DMT)-like permease